MVEATVVYILYAVYFPQGGAPGSLEYVVLGVYSTLQKAIEQQPGTYKRNEQGEWWQQRSWDSNWVIEERTVDAPAER